jgi:hypothetical protein
VHVIYSVKHDGCRKWHCVADGNLTDPVKESSYSGVVFLRSVRIVLMVSELTELKTMVGDFRNAYLSAMTRVLIYIVAGPEFGSQQGNTLVIRKALYGLSTSGARFHEKLAYNFPDFAFKPGYEYLDVWIKDCGI